MPEWPLNPGNLDVAAYDDAEVPSFCHERGQEVWQARLPSAAEVICTSDLERRLRLS